MTWKRTFLGFCTVTFVLFFVVCPVFSAVLFVFDYTIDEFVVGEKKAEFAVCYANGNKYSDKRTSYTSSFLKRWFAGEKSIRETTHVLLDKDVIREIDFLKFRVIDFPIERIIDPDWYDRNTPLDIPGEVQGAIDERYEVKSPVFKMDVSPEPVRVDGRMCSHAVATIQLETLDKIKNASSLTLIRQEMWLTGDIPGIGEYEAFNLALEQRLGIDAARIGIFANILEYWQGSLDPIRESLGSLTGFPVKNKVSVAAVYTVNPGSSDERRTETSIYRTSMMLKEVIDDNPAMDRFFPPEDFKNVVAD